MSTLSARLKAVLIFDGYVTRPAQCRRLVETFGVHPSTAKRWLTGESQPRKIWTQNLLNGYRALNMPMEWLFSGQWEWSFSITERQARIAGQDPRMLKVLASYRDMTPWEQHKFFRLVIRIKQQ